MIEFRGEVSDDCKRQVAKQLMIFFAIYFAVFLLVSLGAALIIYLTAAEGSYWYSMSYFGVVIFGTFLALDLFLFLAALIPGISGWVAQKEVSKVIAGKVTINKDVIDEESQTDSNFYYVSNVTKVVDFGGWYQILFRFPKKTKFVVCQKNLIAKGTIEEFEELFRDKLIKKEKRSASK